MKRSHTKPLFTSTAQLFAVFLLLSFSACMGISNDLSMAESGAGGGALPGSAHEDGSSAGNGSGPGALTAGDWDDNLNFERFENFVRDTQQELGSDAPVLDLAQRNPASRDQVATGLDLAIVLDTTGSMGDELDFIETEIDGIVQDLYAGMPGLSLRLGLVTYRDEGDDYVTRSYDFVDEVVAFRQSVAAERSDGGGDFPEAMDQGLAAANQLDWRLADNVAKVIFVIADAPAHSEKFQRLIQEIDLAREQDRVIFPVAASGADKSLELLMRYMAQDSGGRYVFLTDDSGLGDSHLEPSIPCYLVQKLNKLMVRLSASVIKGAYIPPRDEEIIRAVGDPQDGLCQLSDGAEARLY